MADKNSCGSTLRRLRSEKRKKRIEAAQWTQAEVAKRIGVSRVTYIAWESDEWLPDTEHLKRIVAVFRPNGTDEAALYRAVARVPSEIPHLPFPPNPFFTGRKKYLEQLHHLLQENAAVALTQPVSISGLGGIGKTQLALAYAYRSFPDIYRVVLWVNAANQATLQAGYDALAQRLDLPERDEGDATSRVKAVKQWLDDHTNWLLIMDNADDLQLARSFFPETTNGHILLTTRSQFAGEIGAKPIDIDKMTPAEGLHFLLRRSYPKEDDISPDNVAPDVRQAASQLVKLLDGHPLALDQAGAYIEETGTSFAAYTELYKQERRTLLNRRRSSRSAYGDHPESVVLTFTLSFEKASEQEPLAADILRFCAFLQPDTIPAELFQHDDTFSADTLAFNEGIASLRRYSLLQYKTEEKTHSQHLRTFAMHRLVQDVLIDAMAPDLQKQWKARVLRALSAAFPPAAAGDWGHYERLPPHVLACATWTEDELPPTLEVAELFRTAALCLGGEGRHAEATQLSARTLIMLVLQLGAYHPATMTVLDELAVLCMWQGKNDQAEDLYHQIFAIQDMPPEADHPATAKCLRHLSLLCVKKGKHEEAQSLLERALSIQERCLGAEHPDTAKSLCMLAFLSYIQGDYSQAYALYWRTIRIWDKHLLDERDVNIALDGLSLLDHEQVQYERAVTLFERALNVHIYTSEGARQFAEVLKRMVDNSPRRRRSTGSD